MLAVPSTVKPSVTAVPVTLIPVEVVSNLVEPPLFKKALPLMRFNAS